jgi:hypothetical protein
MAPQRPLLLLAPHGPQNLPAPGSLVQSLALHSFFLTMLKEGGMVADACGTPIPLWNAEGCKVAGRDAHGWLFGHAVFQGWRAIQRVLYIF